MRKCYFSKNYRGIGFGGNKAKTDVETIMARAGFVNVGLKQTLYHNKVKGFIYTLLGVLKAAFSLRKGDVLLLQYPLKKYFSILCKIAHLKGATVIALVHDLGSFRRKKLSAAEEKKRLSNADYIIALNIVMKNWLIEQGYNQPMSTLDVWDYLSESKPMNESKVDLSDISKILYAGSAIVNNILLKNRHHNI